MKERGSFWTDLAKSLQLPEDLRKGEVLVCLKGRSRLTVENFKGLSCYTPCEIKLITKEGILRVSGRNLKILWYTREEMEISGFVCKMDLL